MNPPPAASRQLAELVPLPSFEVRRGRPGVVDCDSGIRSAEVEARLLVTNPLPAASSGDENVRGLVRTLLSSGTHGDAETAAPCWS